MKKNVFLIILIVLFVISYNREDFFNAFMINVAYVKLLDDFLWMLEIVSLALILIIIVHNCEEVRVKKESAFRESLKNVIGEKKLRHNIEFIN